MTTRTAAGVKTANGLDSNSSRMASGCQRHCYRSHRTQQCATAAASSPSAGADFYEPLNLRAAVSAVDATGIERVNDRDAYQLVGHALTKIHRSTLFPDVQSGLLARKTKVARNVPEIIHHSDRHEDYRPTGGVKIPF